MLLATTAEVVYWPGVTHFLNMLLMLFLMRSGIEILSSCPKLYWSHHSIPGTEWLKLTRKEMPTDRLWSGLEEEEDFSPWLSLPGHKQLGIGRLWHFLAAGFWVLNGVVYAVLLFSTAEWRRLLPTSWEIFPAAARTAITYLHLQLPPRGDPYNPLQQLTYFGVVFLVGPLMILTGIAMSPAITARFSWYPRLFGNRQAARSLHFLGLVALALFTVCHVFLVAAEGFIGNVRYIMNGARSGSDVWVTLFFIELAAAVGLQVVATWVSLRWPEKTRDVLTALVDPVRRLLFRRLKSMANYPDSAVSPFFRVNGYPPQSEEFLALAEDDFKHWRLRVKGLVERPLELSLEDLRAMPAKTQTTLHNCIQGWSGIAKWTGVPLSEMIKLCKPLPGARYAVFHSYQWIMGQPFYESLEIDLLEDPQTILALDMNGERLPLEYGAPCRLRCEKVLGYKMVKYLRTVEFVSDFRSIGLGRGGGREDMRLFANYPTM